MNEFARQHVADDRLGHLADLDQPVDGLESEADEDDEDD